MRIVAIASSLLLTWAIPTAPVHGSTEAVATAEAAASVLDEIMSVPMRRIPTSMLADAEGLAIIPNVLKGGFVLGARRGHGVVTMRDHHRNWQAPVFITLTGGSVGWQIGVQSTDVILVFKTRKSVEGLMQGKFTIGADAAVAAGPVGRKASAATDEKLKAEIYSYCRSRGLFAGVSIDGSVLQVDRTANAAFYRPVYAGTHAMRLHPAALKLLARVTHYTQTNMGPPHAAVEHVPPPMTPPVEDTSTGRLTQLRRQLARASLELSAILDDEWERYLALPAEVFDDAGHPSTAALTNALQRYDSIATKRRFGTLSARAEFRAVHQLLRQYRGLLETPRPGRQLELPRPPIQTLPRLSPPRRGQP